jgi:hypothetical protein
MNIHAPTKTLLRQAQLEGTATGTLRALKRKRWLAQGNVRFLQAPRTYHIFLVCEGDSAVICLQPGPHIIVNRERLAVVLNGLLILAQPVIGEAEAA